MTTGRDLARATALAAWVLAGSGALTAVAGGVWWAWDADPSWGQVLLAVGLLVVVLGYLMTRQRPGVLRGRAVIAVAALLVLFAGYQLWCAIATIQSQAAPHLA